jgi:thiamine pyrophosphate-dependent acetolactate synthase large subunit-like protein
VIEAFGGKGWFCEEPSQIKAALDGAAEWGGPAIVHIALDTRAGRKPQEFAWKT